MLGMILMLNELNEKGRLAKAASYELAKLSSDIKNSALIAIADSLRKNKDYINGGKRVKYARGLDRQAYVKRCSDRFDGRGNRTDCCFARPYR